MLRYSRLGVVAASIALCVATPAAADNATVEAGGEQSAKQITRPAQKILQRFDVPGTSYETILMRVEFPPNFDVSRHAHPGPEASYVLFGDCTFVFDGEPPQTRTAGESLALPAYAIHRANAGPDGVVLINSFILEKVQPLSIPAEVPPPR